MIEARPLLSRMYAATASQKGPHSHVGLMSWPTWLAGVMLHVCWSPAHSNPQAGHCIVTWDGISKFMQGSRFGMANLNLAGPAAMQHRAKAKAGKYEDIPAGARHRDRCSLRSLQQFWRPWQAQQLLLQVKDKAYSVQGIMEAAQASTLLVQSDIFENVAKIPWPGCCCTRCRHNRSH